MANTRLVVIDSQDKDSMLMTLYYGNKRADKALVSNMETCTQEVVLATVEQFRLYGLGDTQ